MSRTAQITLSLLFLGVSSLAADTAPEPFSPTEREALIALYMATDGSHWKKHDGWLGPEGTECKWYGVQCGSSHLLPPMGVGIHLDGNNLVGSIPKEIGKLKNLQWLDLAENDLTGSLPDTLGELTQLTELALYGNHFSGRLPDPLIQRWLSGALWINAEASLFTDVSDIDFEWDPSALLCGRRRIILHSDGSAALATTRCRSATPRDRRTFCEVKQGNIGRGEFATLTFILEKNGFYAMRREYSWNVTDSVFESIRVTRDGKRYEVVEYAGGAPFELWVIQRAIEGVALSTTWEKSMRQAKCPRWSDGSKKLTTRF